ncbi:MAG: lasso RiPP family leader peptide-containing protein [Actinomycetota bacterium]
MSLSERPQEYEPPAIEVLGTLEELTEGVGTKNTDALLGSPVG